MSGMRIGDAERSNAVAQLEQHAAAGRLAPAELAERRAQAQSAVYDVDLNALFRDLPGGFNPPPAQRWDLMPGVQSGVADGPQYASQQLATPAVTGPVEQHLAERPRRWSPAGLSVGSVIFFVGLIMMITGVRYGWLIFMIGIFIGPILGSIGPRRRP